MNAQELLTEFVALPDEAQRQVADLVVFLRQRYASEPSNSPIKEVTLMEDDFFGLWRDREDMADSTAWVRKLRMSDWRPKDDPSDSG